MGIGAIFPQNEIGADVGVIREYVGAVQTAGYDHLLIYDHVLGADPTDRPGWRGYTTDNAFHEVFVMLGFIAGIAPGLELATDVLVLPQRQTALVAKQAAEIDILSGGRFRLGVGVDAMGAGLSAPAAHIDAVQRFADTVGLAPAAESVRMVLD